MCVFGGVWRSVVDSFHKTKRHGGEEKPENPEITSSVQTRRNTEIIPVNEQLEEENLPVSESLCAAHWAPLSFPNFTQISFLQK